MERITHNKHQSPHVNLSNTHTMETNIQKFLAENFDAVQVKRSVKDDECVILCTLPTLLDVSRIQFGSEEYHELFDAMQELFECSVFVNSYNDVVALGDDYFDECHPYNA